MGREAVTPPIRHPFSRSRALSTPPVPAPGTYLGDHEATGALVQQVQNSLLAWGAHVLPAPACGGPRLSRVQGAGWSASLGAAGRVGLHQGHQTATAENPVSLMKGLPGFTGPRQLHSALQEQLTSLLNGITLFTLIPPCVST